MTDTNKTLDQTEEDNGDRAMTAKNIAAAIAIAIVFLLSATPAALAQSAYTTGTAASDEAAGYPSPYGNGSGFYAYRPGYGYGHSPRRTSRKVRLHSKHRRNAR
jgi:FlaG/FlaF family flagellin (archaellin)